MTDNKRFELIPNTDITYSLFDYTKKEYVAEHLPIRFEGICDILNGLNEENQQIKQVIKEVLELLEEEVDLFSDKATEHDIQAYIELRELDNKDAYYMAVSTKKAITLLKEMI